MLGRLANVIHRLEGPISDCLWALRELRDILMQSDISPFEVNHSGLIKAMLRFMGAAEPNCGLVQRDDRLRGFMHTFAALPLDGSFSGVLPVLQPASFSAFVAKLNGCVTQLEQFPVKVHDFPAGPGGRSNQSALKFFNTHQLKCNLQRHPECTNLRQWKGGTVKIDPLALVQAIERYLVVRGYGGIRVDSEEDSEEDIDDSVAAAVMSQAGFKHKLQFMMGDFVLPYNMTVYQAVKQYASMNDQSETDTESETPIGEWLHMSCTLTEIFTDFLFISLLTGNASIWVQQHTIFYRPIDDEHSASGGASSSSANNKTAGGASSSTAMSSSRSKSGSKSSSSSKVSRKKTEFWAEGQITAPASALTPFLSAAMPHDMVTVQDASLDALCMLRMVNALNRNWTSLYSCVRHENIVPQAEFIHSKVRRIIGMIVVSSCILKYTLHFTDRRQGQPPAAGPTRHHDRQSATVAAANRHCLSLLVPLRDAPPALLRRVVRSRSCATASARDHARSQFGRHHGARDAAPGPKKESHFARRHSQASRAHNSSKFWSFAFRKVVLIYSNDFCCISFIQDCAHSKALLEIQYENEVGTGLGPTLEFYALVSAEVQRCDLGLWNGSNDSYRNNSAAIGDVVKSSVVAAGATNNIENDPTAQQPTPPAPQHHPLSMLIEQSDTMVFHDVAAAAAGANLASAQQDAAEPVVVQQPPHKSVRDQPPVAYVNAAFGLFPSPLGRAAKSPQISRLKTKFKFLGKFMAKAVMDSRMVRVELLKANATYAITNTNPIRFTCSWIFRARYRFTDGCSAKSTHWVWPTWRLWRPRCRQR